MQSLIQVLHINAASVAFAVAVLATIVAAVFDAVWYRIPNWLTYSLMVIGIFYHTLLPMGRGWQFAVAGFVFGLLILLPFFVLGGVGAGDVKLLAGVGACVGLHDSVAIFLVFGSLTGVYSAALILARFASRRSTLASPAFGMQVDEVLREKKIKRGRPLVPLAPMVAAALLILALAAASPWNISRSRL